ncbi:hypothetical protein GCM10011482_07560 [Enterococcus alcedinis]|uniref:Uncharacterized protein n=1 Tax=Enterococcus alcedinis TaxID=1274384 RepID=A0A917JFG4_9ENTE|nr:hypothetical protein GCM10011482_07560 [Enterococcus alcedinis]
MRESVDTLVKAWYDFEGAYIQVFFEDMLTVEKYNQIECMKLHYFLSHEKNHLDVWVYNSELRKEEYKECLQLTN